MRFNEPAWVDEIVMCQYCRAKPTLEADDQGDEVQVEAYLLEPAPTPGPAPAPVPEPMPEPRPMPVPVPTIKVSP